MLSTQQPLASIFNNGLTGSQTTCSSSTKDTKGKKNKKNSRPPNCFMLFSQENRPLLQAECPKMSNSEISKLLGERWKALHPNKKKIYRDKAEAAKLQLETNREAVAVAVAPLKRGRDDELQAEELIKRPKVIEEALLQPTLLFQPFDFPHETGTELLSFGEDIFGDLNLDFIESLIEANLALNTLPDSSFY